MQTVTTLPVLQAISDSTDHYLGLQPIIKGRTNAEYVNPNLRFNPSSNTLILDANLNLRNSSIKGTALAANTVTGDKLGQNAISANNISNTAQPIGVNQTWTNLTGSRATATTYYNTTGRPIMVFVRCQTTGGAALTVNGVVCAFAGPVTSSTEDGFTTIVPANGSYILSGTLGNSPNWSELR